LGATDKEPPLAAAVKLDGDGPKENWSQDFVRTGSDVEEWIAKPKRMPAGLPFHKLRIAANSFERLIEAKMLLG
jgi:hypothetical protein